MLVGGLLVMVLDLSSGRKRMGRSLTQRRRGHPCSPRCGMGLYEMAIVTGHAEPNRLDNPSLVRVFEREWGRLAANCRRSWFLAFQS